MFSSNDLEKSFSEKDEDYDVKFVLEEKEIVDDNDDCLKEGFHKLVNNLEKDKNYLSKIIIFKYLPKYNRAFVDPNMRIAINPIYFEFSHFFKIVFHRITIQYFFYIF